MSNNRITWTNVHNKTIEFYSSIAEIHIPKEAESKNYTGYIYIYELLEDIIILGVLQPKGKKYLGAGLGAFGYHPKYGTYWHSSQNKWFRAIFYGNKALFKFSIIKIFKNYTWESIGNEERRMLVEVGAAKSDMYFNDSDGVGTYTSPRTEKVKKLRNLVWSIKEKFMKDKTKTVKTVDYEINEQQVSYLVLLAKIQPRQFTQDQVIKDIKHSIDSSGGTELVEPTIVAKDYYKLGVHLVVDGNTTLIILDDKAIPTNNTLWLYKSLYGDMTEDEWELFGDGVNAKKSSNVSIYGNTGRIDAGKKLYDTFYDSNWNKTGKLLIDIPEIYPMLDLMNLRPDEQEGAIKDAMKKIKKVGDSDRNKNHPNYKLQKETTAIIGEIDQLCKDKDLNYNETLFIRINSKSMNQSYNKIGDALRYAKEGKRETLSTITLKDGKKRKKLVYVDDKKLKYNNLTTCYFIVDHGQCEDAKSEFEDGSIDKNGCQTPSHFTNFTNNLRLFGMFLGDADPKDMPSLKYYSLPLKRSDKQA